MISTILTLVIFAPAAWYAFMFVVGYREATGTWYERAWAGARSSATVALAKLILFSDALLQFVDQAAALLADQATADQIKQAIPSKYMAAAIALIAVGSILARMRTLSRA